MLSRRSFLSRVFGSLVLFELNECASAQAASLIKKKKPKQVVITGPHSLSKQAWPPAIVPDFVDIDKKGYLCFSDQFGRFSIVDLRKAGSAKFPPKVIAELTLPCKRVLALKVAKQSYAYALAKEPAEGPDAKFYLIALDLVKPEAPSVISRTELNQIDDADLLFADKDVLFVGGRSRAGEHLISVYSAPGKRSKDASLLASISTKLPVVALDYQKRELIVLEDNNGLNTQIEVYNMGQISSPQQTSSLEVKGCYTHLNRVGDTMIIAGSTDQSKRQMQATTIALKPAPHAVSTVGLDSTEQILSVTAQKGQYLALAKSANGKLTLNSLNIDKLNNLSKSQTIDIPVAKSSSIEQASLIVNGKEMYIASGWSGVQVLNHTTGQWSVAYNYKIPRLAAAGIATWGSQAVLVGAELMLYNIADPEHPELVSTAPLTSSVRAMVGAGSFILCLEKETVTLRKMTELNRTLASVKVPDKCRTLTFDKSQHRAYAGDAMGKLTRIYPVKVFSDNLEAQKSFDLPGNFTNIESVNGTFMAADIHEVALFTIDSQVKEVGRRKFENLAIRDICITDHNLLATAVDQNSKGFLLVLSRVDKELSIEGTIDLPHNGTALSATATRAVAVGRDTSGKDLVSIVDISNAVRPTVKATFNVLESASAVAVQSKIAIVAGRGLEIVTL